MMGVNNIRAMVAFLLLLVMSMEASSQNPTELTVSSSVCNDVQSDCASCIDTDPSCIWCLDAGKENKRCQSSSAPCTSRENPRSFKTVITDEDFTVAGKDYFDNLDLNTIRKVVQLRPQRLKIKLRKNDQYKFNITFKKVIDYPLDLYYVMDLSYSMNDDLATLRGLGLQLVNEIRENVTNNFQLGFGTFVDKPMAPFASTVEEQLQNPCASPIVCAPPFGFRHQLNVSFPGNDTSSNEFSEALASTVISGNIDNPEGGLDALMQIAVCTEVIGWREGATHIVLFATDAPPHIAHDGRLAGILKPNDMGCHMAPASEVNKYLNKDDMVYSMSKYQDYPSLGQLKKVFTDNKIQVIFAVTDDVKHLYEDMPTVIGNNIFVSNLSRDSSNILDVVQSAYNVLRSKLSLNTPTPPPGVKLNYRYLCPNDTEWSNTNLIECNNIEIGDYITYEFELTATECPTGSVNHTMLINSGSLQDEVAIEIDYICECDCKTNGILHNATNCGYKGDLVCGSCECDPGASGSACQCESNGIDHTESCRRDTTSALCENQGECDCSGTCLCNDGFTGDFCHCKTNGCPLASGGKICGNGICKNCDDDRQCICDAGYTRDEDGVCSCSDKLCTTTDGLLCNNKGTCGCDKCNCESTHEGRTCRDCIHPSCSGITATCDGEEIRACVECISGKDKSGQSISGCGQCTDVLETKLLTSFHSCGNCTTGECVSDCNEHSQTGNFQKQSCSFTAGDQCRTTFEIYWKRKTFILYVKQYSKEDDCPKPIDPLLIVLPVVGGIVLIGCVALALWKVAIVMYDKHEYKKFQTEEAKRKWTAGENPLYDPAAKKYQNPTFQEGDEDS